MDLGGSTKGGKKPLDMAINLVPFIDLMAVMISFLIMTAVWNQAGRLQVSPSGGGESTTTTPELPATLSISERAMSLSVGGAALESLPMTRDA